MSAPEFAGRTVVVTATAPGTALATARLLAAGGARVAFLAPDPRDLPAPLIKVHTDFADDQSVRAGVAWAAELLGGIDLLVNVAGTGTGVGADRPAGAPQANLLGAARTARAALLYLRRSAAPAIVIACPVAATQGLPHSAVELAARELTRAMAAELAGDRIRVACAGPGTDEQVVAAIARLARPGSPAHPETPEE
ncbi:SDR family NAD(P)-dependent oxidoreductase [Kitasatospora viridis]|uniref:NADP-dependent 3-hydroxy acid dehydrogenase YdfG n=1 Tax=Kitasatospora viridis TaxID=281105 RepID=A0A561TVK1_9ACTN|nr:SDR family NAD(P)-dependent oxidoreductase [Kitasatospora viridis]TWF91140.1 NADP-dependent 3-hydroxy acid dehydrogenase YdfG [Kitasatospora viridis]